jgi:hypothetical protein
MGFHKKGWKGKVINKVKQEIIGMVRCTAETLDR